jgi:hypothetical protein
MASIASWKSHNSSAETGGPCRSSVNSSGTEPDAFLPPKSSSSLASLIVSGLKTHRSQRRHWNSASALAEGSDGRAQMKWRGSSVIGPQVGQRPWISVLSFGILTNPLSIASLDLQYRLTSLEVLVKPEFDKARSFYRLDTLAGCIYINRFY